MDSRLLRLTCIGVTFLAVLLMPHVVSAATFIEDSIVYEEPVVWTQAGSPYVLGPEVLVEVLSTASLTIEPGVVVKFDQDSLLSVQGDFSAVGTAAEPIAFTSIKNDAIGGDTNGDGSASLPQPSDRWQLYISDWLTVGEIAVSLAHLDISYSRYGVTIENAETRANDILMRDVGWGLYFYLGSAELERISVSNFDWAGVYFDDMSASVRGLSAAGGNGVGVAGFRADVALSDVACADLADACLDTYAGSAAVDTLTATNFRPGASVPAVYLFETPFTLQNASVLNVGQRRALGVYNATGTVSNARFVGGSDDGVEVISFTPNRRASVVMQHVDIANFARTGLYHSDAALTLTDVVITGNGVGIQSELVNTNGPVSISESIIAGNSIAGIQDYSEAPYEIQAVNNWWGDQSGPFEATLNPNGLGNQVSGRVSFTPWLLVPPGLPEEEDPIDPLLRQYLPVLFMHPEETYHPMNVDAFVEGSALWDDRGLLPDELLVARGEGNALDLDYLASSTDSEDWYIQFSGTAAKEFDLAAARARYQNLVQSGKATTTVYVHKMEDSYIDGAGEVHEFIVLQYWYFYAMNNWGEVGGFNNHEGDWESVFVFLDKETEEPRYAAFSAHHNDGEPGFNFMQYGSVRRGWNEVEKREDRPYSYVSLGSHAMYADTGIGGVHFVPGINGEKEDKVSRLDGKMQFALSNISSGGWFSNYEGKWGTDNLSLGQDGPLGPNFIRVGGTERFHNPIEWAGIDSVDNRTVEEPQSEFTFDKSGASMHFAEALSIGTTLGTELFREVISFGSNLNAIEFLPRFWDFDTSLSNGAFSTEVTLSYQDEELPVFGIVEQDLSAYYYNEETSLWEQLPSRVDVAANTVTFTTNHFSRYALGAPLFMPVLDGAVTVSVRPDRFNQQQDTRTYQVTLTNVQTNPVSGTVRIVVDTLTEGAKLMSPTGITLGGDAYVDVELPEELQGGETLAVSLVFRLPIEVKANSNANPQAQKQNVVVKQVNFDIKLLSTN